MTTERRTTASLRSAAALIRRAVTIVTWPASAGLSTHTMRAWRQRGGVSRAGASRSFSLGSRPQKRTASLVDTEAQTTAVRLARHAAAAERVGHVYSRAERLALRDTLVSLMREHQSQQVKPAG